MITHVLDIEFPPKETQTGSWRSKEARGGALSFGPKSRSQAVEVRGARRRPELDQGRGDRMRGPGLVDCGGREAGESTCWTILRVSSPGVFWSRVGQAPSGSSSSSRRVCRFLLWQPPTLVDCHPHSSALTSGSRRPGPGRGLETERACDPGRGKVRLGPAEERRRIAPVSGHAAVRATQPGGGPRGGLPGLHAQAQSWQGTGRRPEEQQLQRPGGGNSAQGLGDLSWSVGSQEKEGPAQKVSTGLRFRSHLCLVLACGLGPIAPLP